ncbi:hypothetical protein Tco_0339682 [Tanacetum coccineum]
MSVPVTAEEKTNKKNDVKAKSLLLMALPNEHQLTFSSRRFIDDLYNNFKIVEQSVKKSVGASGGAQNLAFITASTTSGTNDLNSSTNDLNTVIPAYEVSTASPNVNAASLQVSTASFSDNTVNGFEVAALSAKYEGKKIGRFARVCRVPRNKEGQFRNQDNNRKQGNNEDTSSKAMLAIDGVGFDWSHMAEEQV